MYPLSKVQEKLRSAGKFWLAFTGDSITSCEWVHPNWREIVEYVLKDTAVVDGNWKIPSWGIRTFNFAYDGSTTTDIVKKLDEITSVEPDLIISLMGGNDPVLGVPVEETVKNISAIKELAKTEIVWCTTTPAASFANKDTLYEPYVKATLAIPETERFHLLDVNSLYRAFPMEKFFTFTSEENPEEGLKAGDPDPDHPNQLGNAYIAKIILDKVFGIEFDPERYISDTVKGEKLPKF